MPPLPSRRAAGQAPPAQTPPGAAGAGLRISVRDAIRAVPAGAKIGLVNLQQIAALSAEGKAATLKVQALIQKKQAEGQQKSKALQDNQQKLEQGGGVMNDAARGVCRRTSTGSS